MNVIVQSPFLIDQHSRFEISSNLNEVVCHLGKRASQAPVAQRTEQRPSKPLAEGSNPSGRRDATRPFGFVASLCLGAEILQSLRQQTP